MEQNWKSLKKLWLSILTVCLLVLLAIIMTVPQIGGFITTIVVGLAIICFIAIIMLAGCCVRNPMPLGTFRGAGPAGSCPNKPA